MSNAQNTNGRDELRAAVGSSPSSRLFQPGTFLKSKNGMPVVAAKLDPQGTFRGSITLATCLMILENIEEFERSAIEAARMAKRPGELERLQAIDNGKGKAKAKAKVNYVSGLADEMEGLAE